MTLLLAVMLVLRLVEPDGDIHGVTIQFYATAEECEAVRELEDGTQGPNGWRYIATCETEIKRMPIKEQET